jgi:tetratricopeptide (TPR) repeat protein
MPTVRTRSNYSQRADNSSLKHLIWFLLPLLLCSNIIAQDVQGLLDLLEAGHTDSVRAQLEDLAYQYPGNPGVRFVRAILERDALVAAGIYKDIVRNHPNTPYESPALMRLGEYYFAQGLYIQSRQHLIKMVRKYPADPNLVPSVNLALRSGIAARQLDSVYADLTAAIQRHPDAVFDIPEELDLTRLPSGIRPGVAAEPAPTPVRPLRQLGGTPEPATTRQPEGKFTLQAGAFSTRANAQNMKEQIETVGYSVAIQEKEIGGRTLYLVWVGRYIDREAASRAIGLLESALGIKPFPVEVP